MSDDQVLEFECRRARHAVHEILDGDTPDGDAGRWLERHLSRCGACRDFDADLRAVQTSLQSLSASRFPDSALDEVLARTTRRGDRSQAARWRIEWRSFAAAAVLTAAAFGLWQWNRPGESDELPSTVGMIVIDPARFENDPDYAREITEETRRVLGLTSRALRRTERAAFRGVLVDQVAGALKKVPVDWPEEEQDAETRRNRERENEL